MFKEVFEQSQKELRRVFGMELVELPMREKTKLSQRRGIHYYSNPHCKLDVGLISSQLHRLRTKHLHPQSSTCSRQCSRKLSASRRLFTLMGSRSKLIQDLLQ